MPFAQPPILPVDIVPVVPAARVVVHRGDAIVVGAAARGGPLEVWATRESDGTMTLAQVVGDGTPGGRAVLVNAVATTASALIPTIVHVTISRNGDSVTEFDLSPCDGQTQPLRRGVRRLYPGDCGGPLSRAVVAGIERDARLPVSIETRPVGQRRVVGDGLLGPGRYTVTVRVNDGARYRETDITNNERRFRLVVLARGRRTAPRPDPGPGDRPPSLHEVRRLRALARRGRTLTAAVVPNLMALPAAGLEVGAERGRQWLRFGAIVANTGPGRVEVVAARARPGSRRMVAWQVFRRERRAVGSRRSGTLVYDPRDGHQHWHFDGLARYRLLDAAGRAIRASTKVGFCFLETSVIDMSVPQAEAFPTVPTSPLGCGDVSSPRVRIAVAPGWGDEYAQWLPGQAFDITDLPNGEYAIEIAANVRRRLLETTASDNVSVRRITITGSGASRAVVAEPVAGIDTEAWYGGLVVDRSLAALRDGRPPWAVPFVRR